jgi:cell division protein FtsL
MARTNVAYDLELFQPREARLVALKNNTKVQADRRRRTRRQSTLNVAVYLTVALLALGMVGYFITCNVRLTEMNKQIADGQAQLSALQSEQVRLQSQLAGLTSAERVNAYAQENGLLPVGSNQIYYIEAKEQDQVSLASENDSWLRKAWDALAALLS